MDLHRSPGHPERPERRLAAAEGVSDAGGDRLDEQRVASADEELVAAVHDRAYLDLLVEADARGGGWLDADTYLVPGSLDAARLAAGATVQAAVAVARGSAEVAFAAVRPPGHHAAASRGSGFCLLNNVALAVAAVRESGLARRVAIVDWDVHHGDGTQAIFERDADVCYTSTHQFPFYPGTGSRDERGVGNVHNVPLAAGEGDDAFTAAWADTLLPAIEAFRPEAIIVSAGFDGHRVDPLAELDVTEDGYESVARLVGAVSARLDLPGVALSLEGGYDLDALRRSTAASVRGILDGRAEATDRA